MNVNVLQLLRSRVGRAHLPSIKNVSAEITTF